MAARSQYEELARRLSAVGAVKRGIARLLPSECPGGAAAVLALLDRYGDMRMSRLAELLAIDMSVTSRHVAHVVGRGWVERSPDPGDRRSRILRLTPAGRAVLEDLGRRAADLFAERLGDWTDDEVGLLITLLARLRDSFGDCRAHPARTAPPLTPTPTPTAAQTTRTIPTTPTTSTTHA
ncbi:MarR family winged helix-turn-helix transcriptional regulator [Streptomyces sp. TRM49041]|uniref:MarR family winged helix-turn-helix transcriptional regulator n=1 Tax=Streptomyces sp. TRM49041 TaxID=2603216 RepID=UPI0011ECDACF|nr:MarR family transcriptional regulator [Streptomyces sp. TRM49041]